jgi:transmembrane protein EpsG
MLIWTMFCGLIFIKSKRCIYYGEYLEVRASLIQGILTFSFIIFFIGLRSGVADTPAYILSFIKTPSNLSDVTLSSISKDKGFYILEVIFKQFISLDYHLWLFFVTLLSSICILITLYKHSSMFALSSYIFIASAEFTWLLNGIRQFIVVSILFACVELIIKKKTWTMIIIILILSSIHGTAVIMIPICFIAKSKPWSKNVIISAILICLLGVFLERFSFLLEGTQYDGYIENVASGNGSNIFRFFIAIIPCILAFINRNKIKKKSTSIIDISVNMTLINACIMLVSTITSGLLMGRLSVYFSLYNLILLPWLIGKCFKTKEQPFIYYLCLVFYTVYFYYQIVVTWRLPYISDILKLKLY